MKDSISNKAVQCETGRISHKGYVSWMEDNHPNLTIGDWGKITDYEQVLVECKAAEAECEAYKARFKEAESAGLKQVQDYKDASDSIAELRIELKEEQNLKKWTDLDRSLQVSLEKRNETQAASIGKLNARIEELKNEPKACDWVVIHTTVNYVGAITIVKPGEDFIQYFGDDNGFEEADRKRLSGMTCGDHIYLDLANSISVVRV